MRDEIEQVRRRVVTLSKRGERTPLDCVFVMYSYLIVSRLIVPRAFMLVIRTHLGSRPNSNYDPGASRWIKSGLDNS